jgi:hypothetical protein
MRLYIYYNADDKNKEPHGKFEAINLEDAILVAAHIKQMPVNEFLKIFTVEELKYNGEKKNI